MNSLRMILFTSLVVSFFASCGKNEDETQEQPEEAAIALTVLTPGITESEDSLELTRTISTVHSQTVFVDAGNDVTLEATLELNSLSSTRGTTTLPVGVRYRVIAFKQDDVSSSGYISHADYEVGTMGAIAGNLYVSAAATYTFVCYSLGATTLPAFNQSSLDVAANPATDDLLYAKFNQSITAATATLSYNFAHKFSLVTVIADATSLGQNISAISASLSPNYQATLVLASGVLTAGTAVARTIAWGGITAGQTVASNPCTVFVNGSNSVTVNIPSITIGGTTKTYLTATFGSSTMQGGTKYTLRLNFKRYEGPVVAGRTWASGNLIYSGGNYSFGATQEYYSGVWNGGDYWNWCSLNALDRLGYGTSYNYATNDPCRLVVPNGTWRMPTQNELLNLNGAGFVSSTRNGISGMYFGTSDAAIANANPTKYVFLPRAGRRGEDSRSTIIDMAGTFGYYWSSDFSVSSEDGLRSKGIAISSSAYMGSFSGIPGGGHLIRCVKR